MLLQCIASGLICVSSVYVPHIQHILLVLMAKSSNHPLLLLCGTCNPLFKSFIFGFLGLPVIPGYLTALSEFLCRPDFEACKS